MNKKTADFLVEIGTEELPAQELQTLSIAFAQSIKNYLIENNITFNQDNIKTYATPRRLAVFIADLASHQLEQMITKRGPALTAAYNADGTPTKAALGFAESCGVNIDSLSMQETEKGKWLYFTQTIPGTATIQLLPNLVEKALDTLPIKKRMRWGAGENQFVRPIHWILMLFGTDTIKAKIYNIHTNNYTYGHRIHHAKQIEISSPNSYEQQLADTGHVIASFQTRQNKIKQEILDVAKKAHGNPIIDPNLLDLVTGLVEYPVILLATFDHNFLRVPKECLISAMQDHQKCFAILDTDGNLLPTFILTSNIKSTDPQTVIHGNELVMHARLADAAFYFDNDQKQTLESRVLKLQNIIYQKQLGSLYDKVLRIEKLAAFIAESLNINQIDTKRAAYLCKADLLTNMVYEFPELQGIMGQYYALHDGESKEVAIAIAEHYKPKFAQDSLPDSMIGSIIAIADRIDSLVGFFGIGNIPTGEKDPFALRRQALAVIRILIEKNINLDLKILFTRAWGNYTAKINDPTNELMVFCYDRLKAWCLSNGMQAKIFEAVAYNAPSNPLDFYRRLDAVNQFQKLPAATSLAAANKRVHNLISKNLTANITDKIEFKQSLLSSTEEQNLFTAIQEKELAIIPLMQQTNYVAVLQALATLQIPVDNFFDNVMVMVEDANLRHNRLCLLQRLRNLFLQVADISLL